MRKFSDSKMQTLYTAWGRMRQSCTNKKNPGYWNYGGRGIKVCVRWMLFENFYADMEGAWAPGLSLGRRNNDGNYEPDNCQWETAAQQNRNTRNVRLSLEVAREIRAKAATGIRGIRLAEEYHTDKSMVYLILANKRWAEA